MTNRTTGRWLLVAFAVLAITLAVPLVSAQSNGPTVHDAPSSDTTTAGWAAGMAGHVADCWDAMGRTVGHGPWMSGAGAGVYGPGAGMDGPAQGMPGYGMSDHDTHTLHVGMHPSGYPMRGPGFGGRC